MNITLDSIIKISLAIAVTAALTFNININNTVNNYAEKQEEKINQTIDKIDTLGNSSKLSDAQIVKILKQILSEVK